jgi:hypothetical protein
MYLIIVGNPIDGLNIFGPFDTQEDALWYGENNHVDEDWWFTKTINPDEDED